MCVVGGGGVMPEAEAGRELSIELEVAGGLMPQIEWFGGVTTRKE